MGISKNTLMDHKMLHGLRGKTSAHTFMIRNNILSGHPHLDLIPHKAAITLMSWLKNLNFSKVYAIIGFSCHLYVQMKKYRLFTKKILDIL